MSGYTYSTKVAENCAKAVGLSLPISRKLAVETLNMIRGKSVARAKTMLEEVTAKKRPVALKRYYEEVPHRRGPLATGKFPVKCSSYILGVLKNAEANAQFKGLNTADLRITHASAQRGPTTHKYGRHRGQAKRTHIEIVVMEAAKKKKEAKQ